MGSSPYAMQSKGFEKWPNATDTYFFSALPAGYLNYYGVRFYSAGDDARFWSATETGSYNAYFWFLTAGIAHLDYYANGIRKEDGLSVRCVKDTVE